MADDQKRADKARALKDARAKKRKKPKVKSPSSASSAGDSPTQVDASSGDSHSRSPQIVDVRRTDDVTVTLPRDLVNFVQALGGVVGASKQNVQDAQPAQPETNGAAAQPKQREASDEEIADLMDDVEEQVEGAIAPVIDRRRVQPTVRTRPQTALVSREVPERHQSSHIDDEKWDGLYRFSEVIITPSLAIFGACCLVYFLVTHYVGIRPEALLKIEQFKISLGITFILLALLIGVVSAGEAFAPRARKTATLTLLVFLIISIAAFIGTYAVLLNKGTYPELKPKWQNEKKEEKTPTLEEKNPKKEEKDASDEKDPFK